MEIISIDTNILLRWLLGDNEVQTVKIDKFFDTLKNKKIIILDIVIAESVWVMESVYKLSRQEVVQVLNVIIADDKFQFNRVVIEQTLDLYLEKTKISFTDCLISYQSHNQKATPLYTFDKFLARDCSALVRLLL